MLLITAVLSAAMNLVVIAGVPFLGYFVYQKVRHRRPAREIARRAGLQLGDATYIGYSAAAAIAGVGILVFWAPPLDALVRDGSPQQPFRGLGVDARSVTMALLYGFVQTGFSEELLFRGLIAGSLLRRLSLRWAVLGQAAVFLLPHLLVLRVMPEMWIVLPAIFAAGLFMGWVRIKSGSIIGSWLMHGSLNAAVCLDVAIRTAAGT